MKQAKLMRIKAHPDRLKKPGMTEEDLSRIDDEAGRVAHAAEVLMDPIKVFPPSRFAGLVKLIQFT